MKINYKNDKLRKLCQQQREATKKLGSQGARKLNARLFDIDAAGNVSELIAGRPHPLAHDRHGQFAVDLVGGVRLVFVPDHEPVPVDEYNGIAWSEVTKVTIVFIGDYHD